MSAMLMDCVADCFQGSGNLAGMHCLGAVSGGDSGSPSGMSSRGGVMSVVRALGVLVCEGRIQGPPRGYKEGPHCAAPLQPSANDHKCDKDNYLCGRYLVLVREIGERITIGTSLCVEVSMCSDCPCGLARATCKDPVSLASSTAISQWQHPSDVLLEYWSVSVVPCKSPEMMNSQGLYQAVRSRLHFSQVAAWWSRSNGTKPNYVTTRIVPHNEDNLRKFRESPIEHTFPLAGSGDGNSIKVTVWALPRMEDVPTLNCPLHPLKDNEEECGARALTPTKNGPVPSSSHTPEALVLPVLVDDRLQTPCDKPGKHHCHCEDEEGSPPSPSIRPNVERKRRRSLPCGPSESGPSASALNSLSTLPSVRETTPQNFPDSSQNSSFPRYTESQIYPSRSHQRTDSERSQRSEIPIVYENHPYITSVNFETNFRSQISLDDNEGNDEKRYKPSSETSENFVNSQNNEKIEQTTTTENSSFTEISLENSNDRNYNKTIVDDGFSEKLDNFVVVETSETPKIHGEGCEKNLRRCSNDNKSQTSMKRGIETNIVTNPFVDKNFYHESNPGSSSYIAEPRKNVSPTSTLCTVHQNYSKTSRSSSSVPKSSKIDDNSKTNVEKNSFATNKDLSNLMSKLSFPKEKPTTSSVGKIRDEVGIFDWFSKVPSKVLSAPSTVVNDEKTKTNDNKIVSESMNNDVKLKNCNLELSQREFDEVLAVLRSRTPSGRKRIPIKTFRRRERGESTSDVNSKINDFNYDKNCLCPIHREIRRNNEKSCMCKFCKKIERSVNNETTIYRCETETSNSQIFETKLTEDKTTRNVDKTSERLQNVSNKADVLLGAILRTRERRGLSDISNGARPRQITSFNRENTLDDVESSNSRKFVNDEDKSLPSVLNKRLNRLKQLFKKECEIGRLPTTEIRSGDYFDDESRGTKNCEKKYVEDLDFNDKKLDEIGVKRKIDLIKFSDYSERTKEIYENKNCRGTVDDVDKISKTFCESKGPNMAGDCCETFCKNTGSLGGMENCLESSKTSRRINGDVAIDVDDDETSEKGVPSAIEQERFRRSLENAASMVFHSRTGLPLTSSPAPLRRGSCCFDYDSSLISVSSKRSALFELNTPPSPGAVSLEETDREIENSCEGEETTKRTSTVRSRPQSHALLGSFEESALNGRLEPVSTVHGFTAELGASGTFCPKHRKLPVTVFFYTLGDNDKVSTPYLAHINLGKKGYQVPRSGTIQVTLLNPLGTVVKMFVVLYDLSDMPPRSHTFLRQRTLRDKTLRYLVHLRFMSGKSGRIYLHTDIRMIICRKSDVDTASDFGSEPPKELRSYIHGPTNPKFSPRC